MSVLGYILSALGRRPLRAVEDENDRDGELGETGEAIEKGSELGDRTGGRVIVSGGLLKLLKPNPTEVKS